MHFLERDIIVDSRPDKVWEFLSTPVNLNELTPHSLHFQILSEVPEKMYDGLLILYDIRIPLFGRHRWLTEVKHIREGASFVDEQRIGPYKFWYHQHLVTPHEGGQSRILDRVCYLLPYGLMGILVHRLWVRKMLEGIFDYRAQRLGELFGHQAADS